MTSLNGVVIQPLVDAGIIVQKTHLAPVSVRIETVKASNAYQKSWSLRETTGSKVIATGSTGAMTHGHGRLIAI